MVAAASLWALLGVYTRVLVPRGYRPDEVAFWRAAGGGACFVVHALVRRQSLRIGRQWWPRMALFAIVCVSIFFAAVPFAVDAGGITLAFVLLYTAPIWVTLGAGLWLGEHITARAWWLVAVTVAGVVLISWPSGSGGGSGIDVSVISVGWGLVAGISYAGFYLVGRNLFEGLGARVVYAVALPVGAVPLFLLANVHVPTASDALVLFGLAAGTTWLPYLLFSYGLQRLPSSKAVVIATTEPVIASAIGWTFYDERLGMLGIAGVAVVLAASVAAARR